MREINLLEGYPSPKTPRLVSKNLRTIDHRLVATKRDENFYDGGREFGYGGFNYDGRWRKIAKKIIKLYSLHEQEKVLQINSEKGFLLSDLKKENSNLKIYGTETSEYAIQKTEDNIKENVIFSKPHTLPFTDNYFDFVIALGVVYTQNLDYALETLKEIIRVSKQNCFVTLASYTTQADYFLFKDWTLLGTTILKKSEWIKVLKSVKYEGDYYFTNAKTLELLRK